MTKEKLKAYEEQLEPCPFCGGKARIKNGFGWWWVGCANSRDKCKVTCHTYQYESPEETIKIWNKRGGEE